MSTSSLNRRITELHINVKRVAQRRDYAELCRAVVSLVEVVDQLERRVYELEDQMPVAAEKTVTPPNESVPLDWKEDEDDNSVAVRAATSFVEASEAAHASEPREDNIAAPDDATAALAAILTSKEGSETAEKVAEALKKSPEPEPSATQSAAIPGDASGDRTADSVAEAQAAEESPQASLEEGTPPLEDALLTEEEGEVVKRYFMRRMASVNRYISKKK